MKSATIELVRPVIGLLIVTLGVFGLVYTLCGTGAGQLLYREQANGSLIIQNGTVRGSYLVAQAFPNQQYFLSRPSAANYDPMTMGASNMALSNPALNARIRKDALDLRARLGLEPKQTIPADLLTESASGIDPDISVESALLQLPAVASARHVSTQRLQSLVSELTQTPQFGLLGEARVNVMQLNTHLDQLDKVKN
ncbi:potassium-transporting ATPase subunit KdpC [Limnobacter litoralis]|uniref:Potassium-transporting ATPase KdpC subunit n=1 Tax=Limnobacter litoralis TaxID=481366 RepID=A0ABQ5YR68_9BURK|nr:potassium-transporting ATPase subunit KdpC [Limnobacter litoralis]GLR27084.1 potassium-transporting ATPase KdpC subunit [Limnobacter litoralis]